MEVEVYSQNIADYVPGYDWIPCRFGPPPGIPKARKDDFDNMSDKEYLHAFLKLSQEEKESLMVSEAERRRTYTAYWPIEAIVKANDCAKEGFYYAGERDWVQCAFCGTSVQNWERGDGPKLRHKEAFAMCRIVQNKPGRNIPVEESEHRDLLTDQLSHPCNAGMDDEGSVGLSYQVNIAAANQPQHAPQSEVCSRVETFMSLGYSNDNPILADRLCEAGFFYEGQEDKVKCFWCNGALNLWRETDDPWIEHAKWYPGCVFVRRTKGFSYIKQARSTMSPEDLNVAGALQYNSGDVSFLEDNRTIQSHRDFPQRDGYKFCVALGYSPEHIRKAYQANDGLEFKQQSTLVAIVQDLAENDLTKLNKYKALKEANNVGAEAAIDADIQQPERLRDGSQLIRELLTQENAWEFIALGTCIQCNTEKREVVCIPCGHLHLCEACFRRNYEQGGSRKCPDCNTPIKDRVRLNLTTRG